MIHVVDIGANPCDGPPPYAGMLAAGLCSVIGFEPQALALGELRSHAGPLETYLPDAIGDGAAHMLYRTSATGMSSLLRPDARSLAQFPGFTGWGTVVSSDWIHTKRLDDVIDHADMLKLDTQGSELMILRGGERVLASVAVVHIEISFVPLYHGQPPFGAVDLFMRGHGFVPHHYATIKKWASDLGDRLLEADVVYVRDPCKPISTEAHDALDLILHHVYSA